MLAETSAPRRSSRFRLYLPYCLLVILAVGWSAAWFIIRGQVLSGLDDWLAAEAAAGRQWTCPERKAAGYPFRIEVTCSSLTLRRPDLSASLGRVLAVSQVYAPGHVIVEAQPPLRVDAGGLSIETTWTLLQASLVTRDGTVQRAALAADTPRATVAAGGNAPVKVEAKRAELHLRPDPAIATSTDVALDLAGAVLPGLDGLIGGTEPADLSAVAVVSRTDDLPAGALVAELERWRRSGGAVELTRASLAKGSRRIEAKGTFAIDDAHRPTGRLEASASGLEGLAGRLVGDKGILGGRLLEALAGSRGRPASADPAGAGLKPLPPVRLEGGRVLVGPLPVPGLPLPRLY